MGWSKMGRSGLGRVFVRGRKRVPKPPARIIASMDFGRAEGVIRVLGMVHQ
jgi:hypothetical protein